jgi:restriction endonuclease S subunit
MAKINYSEIKVAAARTTLFNNIRNVIESVNIHDVIKLSSGINLPSHKMIDGQYPVFGGGGSTSFTHEAYNVDFETLAIGRVGARCGCVFKVQKKSWVTDNALYALSVDNRFDLDYVINYLSYVDLNQFANRAAQPVISLKRISTINFPLVELSLQKKIVEIIKQVEKGETNFDGDSFGLDKSLKSVDSIRLLQNELTFQLTQLENLNQAILQEAVQGKLVTQDAADEPASVLLNRIKAEKAASGKKEKPLPAIKAEEIPFKIPESWVWCKLGEVIIYTENLDIQKYLSPDTIVNYVDIDAIDNQSYIIKEAKQKQVRELSTRARRVLKPNHIAYSTVRPYLKNIAIIEEELDNYIGSTGFNVFRTLEVELKYVFYFLLTPFVNNKFKDLMVGFNSPSITNDQFEKCFFPLPPLSEQKCIVAEIEKQIERTKQLKKHIIANQLATEQLLKALLHGAFEVEEKENI